MRAVPPNIWKSSVGMIIIHSRSFKFALPACSYSFFVLRWGCVQLHQNLFKHNLSSPLGRGFRVLSCLPGATGICGGFFFQKTQIQALSLTRTGKLIHATATWANRHATPLFFSLCLLPPPGVVRQPIFALARCYLRGSWKVVMEGWLRPVTSCSFNPGTLSGKVMAKPARCSSHF